MVHNTKTFHISHIAANHYVFPGIILFFLKIMVVRFFFIKYVIFKYISLFLFFVVAYTARQPNALKC